MSEAIKLTPEDIQNGIIKFGLVPKLVNLGIITTKERSEYSARDWALP